MTALYADAIADDMLDVLGAAAVYASLHSGNPSTTGANELSGDGYARVAITFNAAADQAITNDGVVTFGPATDDWVEATYFGLWDALAGNFLCGAALNAGVTVENLGTASFADESLVISLAAL